MGIINKEVNIIEYESEQNQIAKAMKIARKVGLSQGHIDRNITIEDLFTCFDQLDIARQSQLIAELQQRLVFNCFKTTK
jgi:hypothetical protein